MVGLSQIQQFPDFMETFPGQLRTICPSCEILGIFGSMESAPQSIW